MKNFKKIAFGLMVGALAIGFSAFTSANAHNKFLTTYYPVKTSATTFSWQAVNPANYNCVSGGAACDGYQAATPPADNSIPSGYNANSHVLQIKP